MKTIQTILIIAGLTFTSLCSGQLFSENNSTELYYTAFYDISNNRTEHRVDPFPARTGTGDYFNVPLLSRTYFVPIEYDIPVENWMTSPFESSYYEEEILIESWMKAPFESAILEDLLQVESWMTRPFTLKELSDEIQDEDIEVEDWMSKPWV